MINNDPLKLFDALKKKEQIRSNGTNVSFGNSNVLKLKSGNTYSLRLLWLPGEKRDVPMINQYVHRIWDDNAVGQKGIEVICPTTEYDIGVNPNGFNACPICRKLSQLYKEAASGIKSSEELYKKFKRIFVGYVPVYVVSGPEEDAHKIKILKYSILFKKVFDEKIFGSNQQDANDEIADNQVGIDAFMYYNPNDDVVVTDGFNLIINVSSKNVPIGSRQVTMPEYKIDFSRKKTRVSDFDGEEITPEYFKRLAATLNFDEDFYKFSNENELNRFYNKYLDSSNDTIDDYSNKSFAYEEKEINPHIKNNINSDVEVKNNDIQQSEDELEERPKPKTKSVSKKEPKVEAEPENNNSSSNDTISDDEFDDLLKDII